MAMSSNDPPENTESSEIDAFRAEDGCLRLLNKRNVLRALILLLIGAFLVGYLVGLR